MRAAWTARREAEHPEQARRQGLTDKSESNAVELGSGPITGPLPGLFVPAFFPAWLRRNSHVHASP